MYHFFVTVSIFKFYTETGKSLVFTVFEKSSFFWWKSSIQAGFFWFFLSCIIAEDYLSPFQLVLRNLWTFEGWDAKFNQCATAINGKN